MKKSRIIFCVSIVTTLIIVSSCQLMCVKAELTKNEAKWYKHFKDSSIYIYKSNQGNIDSLNCDIQRDGYTKCAPFEISNYKQRYIYINFFLSGGEGVKYKNDVIIKIIKENEKESANVCLYVFDDFWCGRFSDITTAKFNSKNFRMKLNTPFVKKLNSFIWIDTVGLQSYTLTSGERYQLVKVIK